MVLSNIISGVGVAILLVAFIGNTLGRFTATGRPYQLLNFVGAGAAATGALLIPFWPFVVLEGTWAVVAAVSLVRRRPRAAH